MALFAETLFVSQGYTRTSASNDGYWRALDLQARIEFYLGYTVQYAPGLDASGIYGQTDTHHRAILIADSLSWNEKLAILAHEGGHALAPPNLSEGQAEVFAEAVSALVSHDGLWEHARYIARTRTDDLILFAEWREIYRAAAILEGQ